MTQTLALLVDGYRELNSKRLFWFVLVLSGLVALIFAAIGIDQNKLTLFGWHLPFNAIGLSMLRPAEFYEFLFAYFGVQGWMSWIAVGLALISTAGLFPDFLAGGSVDLYLSKPIARWRLLATKYVAALLFVGLQAAVFAACCFVVLRARGHVWVPSVFMAVPGVVLAFSYLFAFSTLVGVVTRSTLAAILLTALFWFLIWGLESAEVAFYNAQVAFTMQVDDLDRRIAVDEQRLAHPTSRPANARWFTVPSTQMVEREVDQLRAERRDANHDTTDRLHAILYAVVAPLPKPGPSSLIFGRYACRDVKSEWIREVLGFADEPTVDDDPQPRRPAGRRRSPGLEALDNPAAQARANFDVSHRAVTWTIGTSLGFEAVLLGLAMWRFGRRDY